MQKNIFSKAGKAVLLIVALLLGYASCSDDPVVPTKREIPENLLGDPHANGSNELRAPELPKGPTYFYVPEGVTRVHAYNAIDSLDMGEIDVVDGRVGFTTDQWTTIEVYDAAAPARTVLLGTLQVQPKTNDAVTVRAVPTPFPGTLAVKKSMGSILSVEKQNHIENFPTDLGDIHHNFLFKSDGKPMTLYPCYSFGMCDITLGIFYYDIECKRHDINIWAMTSDWKSPGNLAEVISTDPPGYQISVPKGYLYGFYIKSTNFGNKKFYCEQGLNTYSKPHTYAFSDGDQHFLAFEDLSDDDFDMNDLLFVYTQDVPFVDDPTEETKKKAAEDITPPTPVPPEAEKKTSFKCGDIHVEANFERTDPYVRLAVTLKSDTTYFYDFTPLYDVCKQDDFRIAGKNDVTLLYIPNGQTMTAEGVEITATNGWPTTAGVIVGKTVKSGVYSLKIELRPKPEITYEEIIKILDNLCTLKEDNWVDMGGSVYWKKSNLGASLPESTGLYYQWAGIKEPVGKDYRYLSSPYMNADEWEYDKYNDTDNLKQLLPEDDAAVQRLEAPWRTPTAAEFKELMDGCTWTWVCEGNVAGYEIVSNTTQNTLFLPACGNRAGINVNLFQKEGWYLTSTRGALGYEEGDEFTGMRFTSTKQELVPQLRASGHQIRPVMSKNAKK